MSRCFPYPPPGYEKSAALIESVLKLSLGRSLRTCAAAGCLLLDLGFVQEQRKKSVYVLKKGAVGVKRGKMNRRFEFADAVVGYSGVLGIARPVMDYLENPFHVWSDQIWRCLPLDSFYTDFCYGAVGRCVVTRRRETLAVQTEVLEEASFLGA